MKIPAIGILFLLSCSAMGQNEMIMNEKWKYHLINDNFSRPTCGVEFPDGSIMIGIYHSMMKNYQDFSTILLLDSSGNEIKSIILTDTMNNYVHDICLASDTTAIIVGKAGPLGQNGSMPGDFYITKLNSTGEVIWNKKYGSSDADEATCVIPDKQGGAYVCGTVGYGDGDVSEFYGKNYSYDIWALHIDANGNILWQHTMGGNGYEKPYDMKALPDGGILILGETSSDDGLIGSNDGQFDALMYKLDSTGRLVWKYIQGTNVNDKFLDGIVTDATIMARLFKSKYVLKNDKTKIKEYNITISYDGELITQKVADRNLMFINNAAYFYYKKNPEGENSIRCISIPETNPKQTYCFPWDTHTQLEDVIKLHNGDLLLLIGVNISTLETFIVRLEN